MKKGFGRVLLSVCLTAALGISAPGAQAARLTGTLETELNPTQQAQTDAYPADSSMYRGTVVELYEDGDIISFTLEQETGTNFGAPRIQVEAPASRAAGIETGDYIEIFYGASIRNQEAVQAIAVRELTDASLSNYNGEVVSIDRDRKTILCRGLETDSETIFRYTDNTQLYLDLDSLEPGDKINIYHSGMMTRSIPPQGNALEIRRYADTRIYRGTITAISGDGDTRTVLLQRAAGTDFADSIQVTTGRGTFLNGNLSVGDYAEVLCDRSEEPFAYSIEILLPPESCVYNCTLVEKIYERSDGQEGSLTVSGMSDGETMIFHYNAYTDFTQGVESLEPGDQLSIYHRGVATLSIPPQGSALEISPYKP